MSKSTRNSKKNTTTVNTSEKQETSTANAPEQSATPVNPDTCAVQGPISIPTLPSGYRKREFVKAFWRDAYDNKIETRAILLKPIKGACFFVHKHNAEDIADDKYPWSVTEADTGWFIGRGDTPASALKDARMNMREYGLEQSVSTWEEIYEHFPDSCNPHLIDVDVYRDWVKLVKMTMELSPSTDKK